MSGVLDQTAGVAQRVTELAVDPRLIVVAVLGGIVTSIVAAWIPARNASRVDPVQALQKGKYQVLSAGENRRRRWMAFVVSVISIVCLFLSYSKPFFYAGHVLMIVAGLLLAPTLTLFLSKALRPILKRFLAAEGTLAADSLVQAPRRTSATVSALMLSLAMVVGFGGFAHSFYTSVGEWMETALNPDFFLSPSANLVARAITFPGEVGDAIARVPGVAQVQLVRNARVPFRDVPVLVLAIETEKLSGTVQRHPVAGTLEEMNRLTSQGSGMIVSDNFAQIHQMRMGDVVDLPTPSGLLKLPIVGIVRDYSDLQGAVFIDRAVYVKWWRDDTANVARVYVKKGEDVSAVRQRVIEAMDPHNRLLVLTNREVREWIMKLIDQWFALTYRSEERR